MFDAVGNDGFNGLTFFTIEEKTGRSNVFSTQATSLFCQFNVLNQLGMDIKLQQWEKPSVNGAGFLPSALLAKSEKMDCLCGKGTYQAGYPAIGAQYK